MSSTGKNKCRRSLIRALRHEGGFSQEVLAQQSNRSPDTIRRLEKNAFSPSLVTLKKLSSGLGIRLSTLFALHDGGELSPTWELEDMLTDRTPEEIRFVTDVARQLLAGLGRMQQTRTEPYCSSVYLSLESSPNS
ncbi:MAG: helix-turn-helix transcriptional regulator [Myxococcales bacterium]|nr:helix-turn-helix transcriptional regulator [Myxococcales bacterium]